MKGTVGRAREALQSHDFRFLLVARLVSTSGDGLFNATIVGVAAFSPDQDTAVGLARALAILILPYSVLGPFIGVFIDRWSRRKILVRTPLLRAALVLPLIAFADRPESSQFLAAALAVASVNRFFSSAATAVTPRVVPEADLLMANSMSTVGGTLTMAVMAFCGGLLLDAFGVTPVLAALVLTWSLAGIFARSISTELSAPHAAEMRLRHDLARVASEFVDGIRRLARTPAALAPIASIAWDQALQGCVFVLSIVVFRERFQEGVGSYSWMLAAGAIGLLAGIATAGLLEERMPKARIVMMSFAVSGIGLLGATLLITRMTVLVQAFVVGLSYAWKKVCIDTMIQEAVPDDYRGRVFSVSDVLFNIGRVGGTALAVWLIPAAGVRGTLLFCGAGFLVWIPLMSVWLRRAEAPGVWESPVA